MTVREALEAAASRLARAAVADPAWNAELLLRHVTAWDRASLLLHDRDAMPLAVEEGFWRLVAERAQRRPLQHLTGTQAFWRHEFLVTPDVLIPRPETELLVEASLSALTDVPAPCVVDVGTGSGCIALSLARERADAVIEAIDVSPAALDVAAENARRMGLAGRVAFHRGDFLAPVLDRGESFHLVVSNPPYVDPAEIGDLAPEVRDHEPRAALVPPGPDRYGAYRVIAPQAWRVLRHGGLLAFEIGQGMDEVVASLCRAAGLQVADILSDLQAIPRAVLARKP